MIKLLKYFFFLQLSFFILLDKSLAEDTPKSDFLSLCLMTDTFGTKEVQAKICHEIADRLLGGPKAKDIVSLTPDQIGAPKMSLDSKIHFFAFNDPNFLVGMAYCYFVFRGWISPQTISPDQLAMAASGFSILNEKIKDYAEWLKNSDSGKKCNARVEKESEVKVADLEKALGGYVAIIGLNPYAAILTPPVSLESVLQEMRLTINHERIHGYHVACPAFEKWSIGQWTALKTDKKNELIKKYPSYNWTVPAVAGREFIGFQYEQDPKKVEDLPEIKQCTLK